MSRVPSYAQFYLTKGETMTLEPSHEDQLNNVFFAEAFPDADSPAELYRQVYKYTDCGAWLSVLIEYYKTIEPDGFNDFPFDKLVSEWVHCGEWQPWNLERLRPKRCTRHRHDGWEHC